MRKYSILILALIMGYLIPKPVASSLAQNHFHIVLSHVFNTEGQDVHRRQTALNNAINWLRFTNTNLYTHILSTHPCALVPSLLIAQGTHRERDIPRTVMWLERAVTARPHPKTQPAIISPSSGQILPTADLQINWNANGWDYRVDPNTTSIIQKNENLTVVFKNNPKDRQIVILSWNWPFRMSYWDTMLLRIKLEKGTFLTFETTNSGTITRHLNYYQGQGKWESFLLPLGEGSILTAINLSLSEPYADPGGKRYSAEIAPLRLFFDNEKYGKCAP